MTPRQICEKIVEQGHCRWVSCTECPLIQEKGECLEPLISAKKWLSDHKEEEEMTEERIRQIAIEEAEVLLAKYGIGEREEKQTGMICSACGKPCFGTTGGVSGGQVTAVSSCCKATIQQKITEEYYTPEPGEDPHLSHGTPCEARDWDGEEWEKTVYCGWDRSQDYEYSIKDDRVNEIRFRLSDIQDRGEKMVGKMVKAWNEDERISIIGLCTNYWSGGNGKYEITNNLGRTARRCHARHYCQSWEV